MVVDTWHTLAISYDGANFFKVGLMEFSPLLGLVLLLLFLLALLLLLLLVA